MELHDLIIKGNLSEDLKLKVLEVLMKMMESADALEREFAIKTLLEHKRSLSYWPERNDQE